MKHLTPEASDNIIEIPKDNEKTQAGSFGGSGVEPLYDYPDAATLHPTDTQYRIAGIRYNRGIERQRDDFIRWVNGNLQKGDPNWSGSVALVT